MPAYHHSDVVRRFLFSDLMRGIAHATAQYSTEPILNADRTRPRHLAEPLPAGGRPA